MPLSRGEPRRWAHKLFPLRGYLDLKKKLMGAVPEKNLCVIVFLQNAVEQFMRINVVDGALGVSAPISMTKLDGQTWEQPHLEKVDGPICVAGMGELSPTLIQTPNV